MNLKNVKNDLAGFSLIEVVVVMGVVGVLSLAVMRLFEMQQNNISMIETKVESNAILSHIGQLFENESVCSFNLKQPNIPDFTSSKYLPFTGAIKRIEIAHLEMPSGLGSQTLLTTGPIPSHRIYVEMIGLDNINRIGTSENYSAELDIQVRSHGLSGTGGTIRRSIPLFLKTDLAAGPGALITSCSTKMSGNSSFLEGWPHFINCGDPISPGEAWALSAVGRYVRNSGPESSSRTSVINFQSNGDYLSISKKSPAHSGAGCIGKSLQDLKSEGRTSSL